MPGSNVTPAGGSPFRPSLTARKGIGKEVALMRRIVIRPAAVDDLDARVLFVSTDNVSAALKLFDAAHESDRRPAEMPEMGTKVDVPNPRLVGLRRYFVKGFRNYVIYYQPCVDGIEVVRLLHGTRDREAILLREP